MKSKQIYIIMALSAIIYLTFTSFKIKSEVKKYEHLFILSEHRDLDHVCISMDGKEYTKLNFEKQIKGPWDFSPIINLIHEYEEKDWELVSTNITTESQSFILQRLKSK